MVFHKDRLTGGDLTSGVREYGELGMGVRTDNPINVKKMGIYLYKIEGDGFFKFYMLPKTELTFRSTSIPNADSIRVLSKYRKYAKTMMGDYFQSQDTDTNKWFNFISVISADFTDNYNGTFNMRAKNIYNLDIVIAGSEASVTVDYHFKLY